MWAAETSPSVVLRSDTASASEGYFVLDWAASTSAAPTPTTRYTLLQSAADGSPRVRAEDLPASGAVTITGLADGRYRYQLVDALQPRSNVVEVSVQHHALSRALGFFGLGLALFCLLVISIVIGHRTTRSADAG